MATGLPADYYRTLGLDRSADSDNVRKAYRKMALKVGVYLYIPVYLHVMAPLGICPLHFFFAVSS